MRRKYHCILLLIVGIMLLFSTTTLAAENNSTFATGKTFNEKCIELANGAENIETIVKSDVPLNKDNVISEQHSPEIYIGYEASTKTIWISSEKQMLLNEDSSEMFKGFTNLKKIDNFNVDSKNVKNISHFFEGCKSLESIDLTSWNLSNIKEMEGTFSGCESLKEIKFPTPIDEETAKKINEENAKKAQEEHKEKPADIAVNLLRPENITAGFFNCKNIEVIDLSIIRSDNLKKVDNTFNGCGKLKTIKTDRSLVFPAGEGVFAGTKELTGSNGTKWTEEHTNNEYARLDNYKQQGYFSNDKNTTVKIEGDNFETTGFVRDDSKNAWSDDYFKGTVKVKDGFEIESVIAELNGQNFTDFKQFEENGSFLIEVDKVPQEGVLFKITTKEKTQNIENKEDSKGEVSTENKSEEKVDNKPIDFNLDNINLKTQATPSISYTAHVQNVGWQSAVSNGSTARTTGKAYRLEAFTASLSNVPSSYGTSGVSYSSVGSATSNSASNGGTTGVTGQDNKITSFKMSLTGGIASHYAIYYRGYFENTEWASWVSSGNTSSSSNRLEAMQAKLVAKPGCTYTIKTVLPSGTTSSTQTIGVDDIGVSKSFSGSSGSGYSAYSYNLTWTGSSVTVGSTSGCTVSKSVTSTGSISSSGSTNGAATITVTPTPKYTTTLSGSYVTSSSGFGTDMATSGSSWTGSFKTSGSYRYLSSVTVKVNGTTLSSSYYTFSGSGSTSGSVTVQASKVTGPITVTVTTYYSPPTSYYDVSFSGTGLTCSNTGSSKFSSSSGWSGYLTASSGYGLPTSISMTRGGSSFSNYSYDASTGYISVSSSYASGALVISATGVSLVGAEFTGVGLTASSGFTSQVINPSNSNFGWTGTFTTQTGYSLPSSVNVTVGGSLLSTSNYTYSTSGSTGTVTVSGSYATGAITVSANGVPATYTASLSGSNVSAVTTNNTVKRISRTKTTSVDGTSSSGNYGNFAYLIDPVTISGASSLDVSVTYATESTSYDWVSVYDSSTTPTASNYDSSISGKLGGTTQSTSNYTVSGSTVNMFFKSDISNDAYYGYYAVISGTVDSSQFGSSKVLYNQPWCGKIQASSGYELPDSITVTCAGSTLATSAYSYDSTTGQIEVYPQYVTGAITVSATAVKAPTYYSGTLNGTHVSATSGFGSTIRENTTWTAYIQADTGYSLPDTITMTREGSTFSNFTYTKSTGKIEVSSSYVTGNFVVTANGVVNQYATTLTTSGGVSTVSGFSSTGATYGQDWSGQIQANTGYKLPTEISVSINNTASNNYSYDSSTGMITVSSSYVTGPIEITANGIIPGATFVTGSDFNTKAISLAGNANNIIHIKRSTTCDDAYKVTANCVSINYSEYPIYMWFDSNTGTLNYWSEVDPYTNENASQMFYGLNEVLSIDLASVDTQKTTDMSQMFNAQKLKTIYGGSKFSTASVTNSSNMFSNCLALVGGNGTKWTSSNVTSAYAKTDRPNDSGYFTLKALEFNTGEGAFEDTTTWARRSVYDGDNLTNGKFDMTKIETPTREGYRFVKWADNNGDSLEETTFTQDIDLSGQSIGSIILQTAIKNINLLTQSTAETIPAGNIIYEKVYTAEWEEMPQVSTLTIMNNDLGELGDITHLDEFTINIQSAGSYTGTIVSPDATRNGQTVNITGNSGSQFTLKSNEQLIVTDVPINSTYTVTKNSLDDYTGQLSYTAQATGTPEVSTVGESQSVSSGQKTLSGDKSDILVFTSRKGSLVPTGLPENTFAYLELAIIAVLVVGYLIYKKKKDSTIE